MYNICMEIWKDIEGFPKYQVSSLGRVRSFARGKERMLVLCINPDGYYYCGLNHVSKTIHRLVALAFIPNPDNKPTVDHINRNPLDNRVENLRWATQSEQTINTRDREHSTPYRNIITRHIVKITRDGKQTTKSFKTLDDALVWRNKMLALSIDERV